MRCNTLSSNGKEEKSRKQKKDLSELKLKTVMRKLKRRTSSVIVAYINFLFSFV